MLIIITVLIIVDKINCLISYFYNVINIYYKNNIEEE
jgi:hypothetical protein